MRVEPVTLTGDHVVLEPDADRHLPALPRLRPAPQVWAWLPWRRPTTEAELAEILAAERRIALPFAQVERATGRAVGITTYRDIDERHRTLEVGGTWIGRPWWRTAINTEAKLLMLRHAFETLGCARVEFKTDARNERSRAAILALGATFEGVRRAHFPASEGGVRDSALFSILSGEWQGAKDRLIARLARHGAAHPHPDPVDAATRIADAAAHLARAELLAQRPTSPQSAPVAA